MAKQSPVIEYYKLSSLGRELGTFYLLPKAKQIADELCDEHPNVRIYRITEQEVPYAPNPRLKI